MDVAYFILVVKAECVGEKLGFRTEFLTNFIVVDEGRVLGEFMPVGITIAWYEIDFIEIVDFIFL